MGKSGKKKQDLQVTQVASGLTDEEVRSVEYLELRLGDVSEKMERWYFAC